MRSCNKSNDLKNENHKFDILWTKAKVFIGISFLTAYLAGCGTAVKDTDNLSATDSATAESVTASTEESKETKSVVKEATEENPSKEELSSSEASQVVESSEEVAYVIDANTVINLIEEKAATYTQIPKDELVAFVFSLNFDYLTEEDKNAIMSTYGMSYEDLSNSYKGYLSDTLKMVKYNWDWHEGNIDSFPDEWHIDKWIRIADLVLNPKDIELASKYDDAVFRATTRSYDMVELQKANSLGIEGFFENRNSLELTLATLDFYMVFGSQKELPTNVFERQVQ